MAGASTGTAAAAEISQQDRMLSIQTPLGADVLLVNTFTASERLSGLFSFELELLADMQTNKHTQVAADHIVGQPVTLNLELADHSQRPFHGIVKRFVQYRQDWRFTYYRAEVVPWMWLLTLTSNCRIFQNLTVPEIVADIFSRLSEGLPNLVRFEDQTAGHYAKWDYCVQYRETDFNFVSRLMEQEGIFYYFRHDSDSHTLVMQDCYRKRNNCGKARYFAEVGVGEREDTLTGLEVGEELRPGKYMVRDHCFQLPNKPLQFAVESQFKRGANDQLEFYDYPGEYAQRVNEPLKDGAQRLQELDSTDANKPGSGQTAVVLRMEEEEIAAQICYGSSACRFLSVGCDFTPIGHPSLKGDYLVTSVQHSITQTPPYCSEFEGRMPYSNSFTCSPASAHYRPARVTPKPIIQGPQTAVVVGKEDEEIWVDKYGRVKVQFFWDREGQHNENSSCWIRVSQPWAGKNWGAMWIPRIGQEVIVDFLEGDPDQPIITGRVYNASQLVPYELPEHRTRSCFQSRTSQNGTAPNFNELRFEDKAGAEQIFMNAERDMDLRVEHDSREYVGAERHVIVHGYDCERFENRKDVTVVDHLRETIQKDEHLHVGGTKKEWIEGASHLHVNLVRREKFDGKLSVTVGGTHEEKVTAKYAVETGQEIHLKAGMNVVIEAPQVSLKGVGGFVDIGPAGVTIQGTMVLINSGGAAGNGTGAQPDDPADPEDPIDPHVADDGSKGDKLN